MCLIYSRMPHDFPSVNNSSLLMKRILPAVRPVISLFLIGMLAIGSAGFVANTLLDGLQYRAIKVSSDRDIDDSMNELAEDGWYPRFVLKFQGDARLIYERERDEDERIYDLEYKAEVIGSGKEIDDTFNKMAKDGWFPRFVFRTGALNQNWRLIMERDPQDDVNNLEYRAILLGEGREVDDKFNQLSVDGWYPLFVVKGLSEHRMLFARDPDNTERTVRFMAKTTFNPKQIDDLYNEHGQDGWEPMFLFQDENEAYRTLFQQPIGEDPFPMEFQARRIDDMSQIDDKFNQYSADDWYPLFVIRDVEELLESYEDSDGRNQTRTVDEVRWRMLFGRDAQ